MNDVVGVSAEEAERLAKELADAQKAQEEIKKLRRTTYETLCLEARKRQLSSSENFDKSILTYSASGLALSLTFLKDFIPIGRAAYPYALYGSWACFLLSIMLTTLSFAVAYKAQSVAMDYYEKYYIDEIDEYFGKKSGYDKWLNRLNWVSGSSFIVAIVTTSLFIGVNLKTASEILEKKLVPAAVAVSPSTLVQPEPVNAVTKSSAATNAKTNIESTEVKH